MSLSSLQVTVRPTDEYRLGWYRHRWCQRRFRRVRIRTGITEQGATILAGASGDYVDKRHKLTRRERLEFLNQDLTYCPAPGGGGGGVINVRFQRAPHQLFLQLYNNTNAALPCST
jgi:hypothetical protein